jgi:hypothetical protein
MVALLAYLTTNGEVTVDTDDEIQAPPLWSPTSVASSAPSWRKA